MVLNLLQVNNSFTQHIFCCVCTSLTHSEIFLNWTSLIHNADVTECLMMTTLQFYDLMK